MVTMANIMTITMATQNLTSELPAANHKRVIVLEKCKYSVMGNQPTVKIVITRSCKPNLKCG